MAENKKSVLLYCDIIHMVEELKDNEAGRLFKHFLRYINDLDPVAPDKLIQIVFEPIKQNLKRDLKKWDSIKIKRSEAGKESAKKRNEQKLTNPTLVEFVKQKSTNSTVNVNVNGNVKEINSQRDFNFDFIEPNFKIPFETWIKYRAEKKKPFTLQVSLESCYKELKELSGNQPLHAIKIVQTCMSNEYLSLCISDKIFKKIIHNHSDDGIL